MGLLIIVEDLGLTLEWLRTIAVLGMKMGECQDQLAGAGQAPHRLEHSPAVARAHARIHHQRGMAAEYDADVGYTSGTRWSGITQTPSAISRTAEVSTTGGGGC